MSYVLAIDVGTSFTAAAISRFDHGSSPAPESLPLGLRGTSVPSVVYYPEDGPILVGEAAERRGLDSPARVVREFKRRVGDAVPISVGGLSLPPEDVFATMARWVADRAEEREGAPPSEVVLTHPAAWGSHRTSVILAAMEARGLKNVTLITEPEAAAVYYASQVRVEDGSTIAVYDLGGGTFDTAVLRKAASNRFELVGRPEGIENLGGADFDAEVLRYVAEHTGDALSKLDTADAGVLGALARLRRECVEAKEALSSDSEASISVLLPGLQQQVRLVRSEFEALIEGPVRDTVDALEQSLAEMELEPADLSAVLLIGGSSRIPLVAQLISEQLDRPIAVDADPKSSICMGAAVSAVLARAEVPDAKESAAAAGEAPVGADATAVGLLAGAAGHVPNRRASWSRKGATAASAVSGAGSGHGHGGAHAPKPTVRLTAIAAAAALFTVLGATAAQSPGGLSSLTSILTPGAEAAPEAGAAADGSGGPGGGSGPGAGAAAAGGAPVAGIEAGVNKPASGAGLNVEASPTSQPSSNAAAGKSAAGGTAAGSGSTPAGSAGSTGAAAGGGAAPGTQAPAGPPAGGTDPIPGTPGTADPGTPVVTPDPVTPVPDPVTPPPADPVTPVPDPVTPPPADPVTPVPDPVTPPPADPVTPAPVDPAPTPVVTQSVQPPPPAETDPAPITPAEPVA
ncbi:Hsp70 family protein [Arthrobacter sp. D3-16]